MSEKMDLGFEKFLLKFVIVGVIVIFAVSTCQEQADPLSSEERAAVREHKEALEAVSAQTAVSALSGGVENDCYKDQVNIEAGRAVLRPEIWVGMSADARARLSRIWLLSMVDGECQPVPVIDGIPAQTVYVPYIDLYESYLRAMNAGDVAMVQLLQSDFRVAPMTSHEYPTLWALRPDDLDGSIEGLDSMRQLFRVKDFYGYGNTIGGVSGERLTHAAIFDGMGGTVKISCEPHDHPGYGLDNTLSLNLKAINAWAGSRYGLTYSGQFVDKTIGPRGLFSSRIPTGTPMYLIPDICIND